MDERMAERRDLTSLNESDDLEVARGEPDPRGWSVVASDGRTIGKVDDLLVDTAAMKVRFLDCDVDEASLGLDPADRHLLIPVGRATLRERDREVYVEGFDTLRLARLHGRGDLSALDARESAAPTTPASTAAAAAEGPAPPGESATERARARAAEPLPKPGGPTRLDAPSDAGESPGR